MKYYLNTGAMRVVEKNERGNVTYRKRYRKGDEVDVSHLEEGRLDVLVEAGTLVESEDDVAETPDAGDATPHGGPFGAASAHQDGTTPAAPPVEPVQDEGSVEANTLTPSNPDADSTAPEPSDDDEEVEDVDAYSEMDYADLQAAAKEANPPIPANQSADDLRAALRSQNV